jgi:NAD(P)-dependent dehydrogenase (short-subunit alcohol dehydrogenase family)
LLGRVAAVTNCICGIGDAVTLHLARDDAQAVICLDLNSAVPDLPAVSPG